MADATRLAASHPFTEYGGVKLFDWSDGGWVPDKGHTFRGGSNSGFGFSVEMSGDGTRFAVSSLFVSQPFNETVELEGVGRLEIYEWP